MPRPRMTDKEYKEYMRWKKKSGELYGVMSEKTSEDEDEIRQTVLSPEKFQTEQDMADYCNIDTNVWYSSKIVTNFWGSKQDPHWQYKIWWKRKEIPKVDVDKIDWESIWDVKKLVLKAKPSPLSYPGHFDRLVITDEHIGMEPNPDGYSLYGGVWDKNELMERARDTINHVNLHQYSKTLHMDFLGDLADGLDGKTARKKHDLPQNMSDQEIFDVALAYKVALMYYALKLYDKVIIWNQCCCNHAPVVDYMVNSALEQIARTAVDENGKKLWGSRLEVHNARRFIEHYTHHKNTFILCHGKDDKNLKFGFKVDLDAKGEKKINSYIDEHFLLQPGVHIEFSKGNDHQKKFDNSSSNRFYYYNYAAYSPASNWVQTNYVPGDSGFDFFNYYDKDDPQSYSNHPYIFSWKK